MYKHFFKRALDIIISGVALLLIGWLLVLIAIFLHFANKGAGAFFLQERPGKDEKIFKVIKFKTMTDERDAEGNLSLKEDVGIGVHKQIGVGVCFDVPHHLAKRDKRSLKLANVHTSKSIMPVLKRTSLNRLRPPTRRF